MSFNSCRCGIRHLCGVWFAVAAALLWISAQSAAYGGPLWGVVVSANYITYDSATGGPGSGSTGNMNSAFNSSWTSPRAAGFTSASVSSYWGQVGDCPIQDCYQSDGESWAQASGSLGGMSVSVFDQTSFYSPGFDVVATADAKIFDTLTFKVAGATSSTVTDIGVQFVAGNPYFDGRNVESTETLQFGGATVEGDLGPYFGGYYLSVADYGWASTPFCGPDPSTCIATPTSLVFDGIYEFQGPSATIPYSMELSTSCDLGGNCDDRTANLELSLPPGVTYTSAAFAPAPEPASWMTILGGLGLVALGGIRKRR
jgi:hypothetical protein